MQLRPNQRNRYGFTKPLILALAFFACAPFAHASTTNGTIDSSYKYAWGNVAGYVNFAPQYGNISVTDSTITGYAWSANDGWINFSPSGSGVTNDSNGTLGGFAWDSSQGWVSFTGVSINSSGKFTGQATGANGYILNFDCSSCNVVTDWRPASARNDVSVHGSSVKKAVTPALVSEPEGIPPALAPANTAPSYAEASAGAAKQTAQGEALASPGVHPGPVFNAASTSSLNSPITHHTVIISTGAGALALILLAFLFFRFIL